MESEAPSKMPVAVWLTAELLLVIPAYIALVILVPILLHSAWNFSQEAATFYKTGLWLGVLFLFLFRVVIHELFHAWAVIRCRYLIKDLTLGSSRWRNPVEFRLFGFPWKVNTLVPFCGTLRFTWTRVVDLVPNSSFIHFVPAIFECICGVAVIGFNLSLLHNALLVPLSPIFYLADVTASLYWLSNIRLNIDLMGKNDVTQAVYIKNLGGSYTGVVFWEILHPNGFSEITLEEAMANAESQPLNPVALGTAAMLCHIKVHPQAGQYFQQFLRVTEHPYLRSFALDAWLTWHLVKGDITFQANAEELARELVRHEEESISTKGTLGAVLVELGKAQEGKEILLDVLAQSESRSDMIYTCVFLALAERTLGNEEAALTHAKNARLLNPKDPILQRLRDAGFNPHEEELAKLTIMSSD